MTKYNIGMVTRNITCLVIIMLSDEIVKMTFYYYVWIGIQR